MRLELVQHLLHDLAARPVALIEDDIAQAVGISQPTASRHLNLLRERGLVASKREGQSVVNTLADQRVIQALDLLRSILASNLQSQAALAETVSETNE